MAEHSFPVVMRQWKRMCNEMRATVGCAPCECPFYNLVCSIKDPKIPDYAKAEQMVMEWAAQHPEPIYPTWYKWISDTTHAVVDHRFLLQPIPAEIAEKFGIKPEKA